MLKIKPEQLKNIEITESFFGNINIPATQNDLTLTIFDKNNNEFIFTVENNQLNIYKK